MDDNNLRDVHRVFMLGIGGMGMRGLAQLLAAQGKTIIGADRDIATLRHEPDFSRYTLVPENDGTDALNGCDLLIYSDAVPADHPLRQAANRQGIPTLMLFDAIGQLSADFMTIAVAGTHGKSSTTAFIAHILIEAGLDPTVLVGASVPAWQGRNARVGQGKYLVVEADEYRDHFLALRPAHVIITTVDFDHPDYFASLAAVTASFQTFLQQIDPAGVIITSATTHAGAADLVWPPSTTVVDTSTASMRLPLPGQHMQHNAALAVALAERLGVDAAQAAQSLASFTGLSRRFERLGRYRGMEVITDYGHHPAEILATLAAARERYPQQKLVALIEPHTDERLRALLPEFAEVVRQAPIDAAVIAPVFRAEGRQVDAPVTTEEMKEQFERAAVPVQYLTSYDELAATLDRLSATADVLIAFSAGILDSKLRQLVIPQKYED